MPHLGSWPEKVANVGTRALRHSTPSSAPIGSLLDLRSHGIKDVRFGTLVDDGWATSPIDGLSTGPAADGPWLGEVTHHPVAAGLRPSQHDPLSTVFGDGFARSVSTVGRGHRRRIGGARFAAMPVHASHSRLVRTPRWPTAVNGHWDDPTDR